MGCPDSKRNGAIIKQLLIDWNSEKNQRIKLQQAYLVLVVLMAIASGLVTLVSLSLGRAIIMFAAILALVYIVNSISWLVLDMIVSKKIDLIAKAHGKKR